MLSLDNNYNNSHDENPMKENSRALDIKLTISCFLLNLFDNKNCRLITFLLTDSRIIEHISKAILDFIEHDPKHVELIMKGLTLLKVVLNLEKDTHLDEENEFESKYLSQMDSQSLFERLENLEPTEISIIALASKIAEKNNLSNSNYENPFMS